MSKYGDPHQLAWEISFFDENHLNYQTSPDLVASPAQMRFMVHLEKDEIYYPCTQTIFDEIMARIQSPVLGEMYARVWSDMHGILKNKVEDEEQRKFLMDLLNIKYQHETANFNVIPSRVEKRLYKLFMVTTQIEDPMRHEKESANQRAVEIYSSDGFIESVNSSTGSSHEPAKCFTEETVESQRRNLDATKLRRLIQASVLPQNLTLENMPKTKEEWNKVFAQPVYGNGWEVFEDFMLTPRQDLLGYWVPRRILFLADQSGEFIFDVAVAKFLVRLGHTVVMAVKSASLYDLVCMGDVENDPVLRELTDKAEKVTNPQLSKNELAAHLRNDKPFKIITDGTMERLNLHRTSVTFSRVFKEADVVISKGKWQRGSLFETRFEFTRDIFNIAADADSHLDMTYKPRSPKTVHFTTDDLENKAREIINTMIEAREKGMTVMFYSGIVGSIPGETETAIAVMSTFVKHLLEQQAQTHIINPSAFFEAGMDADDLMYMWEIVQRSGYIDIWRFQTYQDIEASFALMGRKVPPQWVGKDSTFSTGCTKERIIAADVQRSNPEMQLIGPDLEKFQRRSEYGIGMFHDTRLS